MKHSPGAKGKCHRSDKQVAVGTLGLRRRLQDRNGIITEVREVKRAWTKEVS